MGNLEVLRIFHVNLAVLLEFVEGVDEFDKTMLAGAQRMFD